MDRTKHIVVSAAALPQYSTPARRCNLQKQKQKKYPETSDSDITEINVDKCVNIPHVVYSDLTAWNRNFSKCRNSIASDSDLACE